MSKTVRSVTHLILAIDFGASTTKIVASLEGSPEFTTVVMEPHCQIASVTELESGTYCENSVWVSWGNNCYAVGNLAKAKFDTRLAIKPLKTDATVPKTCSAVAVLAQKLQLDSKFQLTVIAVLPPGELSAGAKYLQHLKVALAKFQTPSRTLSVKLVGGNCYPEGMGILRYHQSQDLAFMNQSVATVMLGYRNASIFFANKGVLQRYASSDLGFHYLLSQIASSTMGYKVETLLAPLVKYRQTGNQKELERILRSGVTANRQEELLTLIAQINRLHRSYIHKLESWLREEISEPVDKIILCGGTADYIQVELDPFLLSRLPAAKAGDEELYIHVGDSLPAAILKTGLGNRFADIYCLWMAYLSAASIQRSSPLGRN